MVKITISKPVAMQRLVEAIQAAGYKRLQFDSRESEIAVMDANDPAPLMAIYTAHTLTADEQAHVDALAQAATARSTILATAQTAVGVQLTALTAAQVRALLACMLYASGGVDPATLTVKPLSEWVK